MRRDVGKGLFGPWWIGAGNSRLFLPVSACSLAIISSAIVGPGQRRQSVSCKGINGGGDEVSNVDSVEKTMFRNVWKCRVLRFHATNGAFI